MGLFKDVGRRVERFKQAAQEAAEEEASHRCSACGERYFTPQDACPECGGDVVAIDAGEDSEGAEAADSADRTEAADSADRAEAADSADDRDGTD